MYVSIKDLSAVVDALGMIEHEVNCRGDAEELEQLGIDLRHLYNKMGKAIRKRKLNRRT